MSQSGESPEFVAHIIDSLRQKEKHYRSGDDIYFALGGKTMTVLASPTAGGKSTTSAEVVRLDPEFAEIDTSTTRGHRDDDPPGFRTGVTYAEFNDAVANANLVNFSVNGQDIYGTYQSGFKAKHNIGPIAAKSIPQILESGLDEANVVYLLVEEAEYEERLRRDRAHFPNFLDRAIEGGESLHFATINSDERWMNFVENSSAAGVTKTARKVIDIVRHNRGEFMTRPHALELIDGMQTALHRVARDVH